MTNEIGRPSIGGSGKYLYLASAIGLRHLCRAAMIAVSISGFAEFIFCGRGNFARLQSLCVWLGGAGTIRGGWMKSDHCRCFILKKS
ncbi:MAG: hypothetical protein KBG72_04430 [Agrobacterium sp.]|nr:hypothetical protein [Agrobacterium sp.]